MMQNLRVIRRVNARLRRCWSHHRCLCCEIDELDRLLFNDEFLQNPRNLWLLQTNQKEDLNVDLASSEWEFCSSSQEVLRSSESSAHQEESHQEKPMKSCLAASTSQQLPARRSRAKIG